MTYESQPPRMIDEAGGPLRAALDAARGDGPSLAQLQALRASLSAATGAGALGAGAGLGANAAGLTLFAKAGLAALVAGAVAGGSLVASGRVSPPSSARFATVVPEPAPSAPAVVVVSAAQSVVEPREAASVRREAAPAPRVEARPRTAPRVASRAPLVGPSEVPVHEPANQPASVAVVATRVEDPSALGEAQAALQHREFARALEVSERLPSEDREGIAIVALARLGRGADAEARARSFFASYPTSIYRRRIEFVLAPSSPR
jgi:hypothetical protein